MLRLKSRAVLCTPSSGLSRQLSTLHVEPGEGEGEGAREGEASARAHEARHHGLCDADDEDEDDDDDDRMGLIHDGANALSGGMSSFGRESAGGGHGSGQGAVGRAFDFAGCSQMGGGTPASQDFGGPDFITPADAQFDAYAGYDAIDKENFKGARSPCVLSPTRNKRPRFGFDVGMSQGEFSQGDALGTGLTQPSQSQGDFTGFRVPRNREPSRSRAVLPRAAMSPPCARNSFLADEDQPAETSAHGRKANCTSAAQLATMSRFRADFVDLGAIGRGGFSKVIKVIGRLDGCHYAVKRTERKLQSDREKQEALREVHIMATLGGCPEIVRYHTSWMEYDHLYIQMELCEGSLSRFIDSPSGERMDERGMLSVLRDVSAALACAHDRGVAHMDIKPDNIFILKGRYKLGDWGRVAQVNGDDRDAGVNEGDARYLPAEVLNDDFRALDRADIWSLGATLYELALATELPSHGPEYQALRQGDVKPIPDGSPRVHEFCVALMAEHPIARPSARDIHTQCLSLC